MISVGIDIGSISAKAAAVRDGPLYDANVAVDEAYERRLYAYYGKGAWCA